jgi:Ino eighty subunit 2
MSSRRLRRKRSLTPPAQISISANRPRRAAAQASAAATADVAARDRETDSPDELRLSGPSSLKLKVGSRLREVDGPAPTTSGTRRGGKPAATGTSHSHTHPLPGRRAQNKPIVEDSSDEEDEDEEEGEEGEEDDAEGDLEEEEDEDAEGDEDDEDAEGDDVDMDDAPPPPPIKIVSAAGRSKPILKATPAAGEGKLRSVEDQEMAMEGSDEELSELDSSAELEDQEGGELAGAGEGEEDVDGEGDEDELDAEGDTDTDGTPSDSRLGTPDPTKLTRRQRGEDEGGLMALSNEAQKKKHLTAEEHAARRAEMARRRKNLSEKRNEEEKVCSRYSPFLRHVLILCRWTRSTACSRSKPPSAAPARKLKPKQWRKPWTQMSTRQRLSTRAGSTPSKGVNLPFRQTTLMLILAPPCSRIQSSKAK